MGIRRKIRESEVRVFIGTQIFLYSMLEAKKWTNPFIEQSSLTIIVSYSYLTYYSSLLICLLFWFSFSLTFLRTRRETDLIIVLLTRGVRWYGTLCSLLLKALASDWDENLRLLAIYLASSKIAYFDACEVITTIHNGNWFPSTCCQVSDLIAIQK